MDITVLILLGLIALVVLDAGSLIQGGRAHRRDQRARASSALGIPLLHSLVHDRGAGLDAAVQVTLRQRGDHPTPIEVEILPPARLVTPPQAAPKLRHAIAMAAYVPAEAPAAAEPTAPAPVLRSVPVRAATEPTVVVAADFQLDASRRTAARPDTSTAGIASFVLDVGTGTLPALRAIAPEDPTMTALGAAPGRSFSGDTGPALRPLEPSLLDRVPDERTTEAIPSLRALELAAREAAALDAPTNELSSLRTLERGVDLPEPFQVRAAATTDEEDLETLATEVELFSLRALEHAAAHATPDDPTVLVPRERGYTDSVMTSATRPIPRSAEPISSAAKPAAPVRSTRKTAVPPPVPMRVRIVSAPARKPRTAPPGPPPRARGSERRVPTHHDTPLGIAILSDLSRKKR